MSAGGPMLITGAAGFIGGAVRRRAAEIGLDLVALDHRWSTPSELLELLDGVRPASCIHLGWYADPINYLSSVKENLASLTDSLDLVDELGRRGCRHLVVAGSSAECVPSGDPGSTSAGALPGPASVYGVAKASLRMFLRTSARPADLTVCWARLFNVTGPGEDPRRLLPSVARAVIAGRPVSLSTGRQLRDYLDVEDVADALLLLSSGAVEGDVDLCSGEGVPLGALLEDLAAELGGTDLLRFGGHRASVAELTDVVGDPTRLKAVTGWHRRFGRSEMIKRVAAEWKSRQTEEV